MKSVAIIGGGITGLTAAFRLQQKNIPVTLYEASDRVGGVIQSARCDGYLAEFGPNTLLETSPKVAALIDDLGLKDRRLYSNPTAKNRYVVRGKRLIKMPESPLGFIATPLFSPVAKLRLLLEPFIQRSDKSREESVAGFVQRRLGREFLDRAVDALVGGVYAGDPQKLSVSQAFPKLYALEQEYGSLIKGQVFGARKRKRSGKVAKPHARKFSFDEGLQVLPEALCAKLKGEVRMCCPVTGLTQSDKAAWNVRWRSHGNEGQTPHSAVLYTGTAFGLSKIEIQARVPVNVSSFADIHYPPVASVVLGFRREDVAHPLDGFGMLIPRLEGLRILGSIFSSSLFPKRAPAGHVTLTSYVGGTRSPELAHKSAEELCRIIYEDLRVLLGISGKQTFKHHVLFPKAIPQYELGYGQFRNLMAETEIGTPGLFLAGHYRDGISMSDCIVSGEQVAERIQKYLADVPVERGTRPVEPHARVAA
jgi:protoporphyrinogen/coproporphyrinogen III oxidase